MRKRYIAFFFSLMLVVLLVACGNTEKQKETVADITVEESETKEKVKEDEQEETVEDEQEETVEAEQEETVETEQEETVEVKPTEIPNDHSHSYTTKVVSATCAKDGYTLNSCECGDSYKTDTVKATGHSYGGWNTTKAATTKEKGKAERVCESCGDVDKKELDKLPKNHEHSYTKKVVEATCKTEGYTTYTCSCGDSYTDNKTNKKAHEYKGKVTAPTCTTDGYTKHTCSKCGSIYTDNKTSATGHSYSLTSNTATCTADGKKTETCGRCGDKKTTNVSATGHKTKTETKEATCMALGYTKVTCQTCKTVVSNTTIPATKNHSWTTKLLPTAAKEAFDDGYSDYMKYLAFSEHNVQACSSCKMVDLSTVKSIYTEYEKANIMLGYVNELRREVLGEGYDLVLDTKLIELANIRAKEIVTNFSHFGGTYTNAGENITNGGPTIKAQFEGWKNSSGHYNNMIKESYKYFAYASYLPDITSATNNYGVQLFWSEMQKEAY